MIKCVIFDLDDTLCDYSKARENAKNLVNVEIQNHCKVDVKKFWKLYHDTESSLFREFTKRNISLKEYRYGRYANVLKSLSVEFPSDLPDKLNDIYVNTANTQIGLFIDAIEILEFLKNNNILLTILSNGPTDGQRMKFKALNLHSWIEHFYISEEIGVSKPHKDSFTYVLTKHDLKPEEVIMVGDSIEYDINGANAAGIEAILIDRKSKHESFEGKKIGSLTELKELVFSNSLSNKCRI